jgi:pilus assembly protein CpaC
MLRGLLVFLLLAGTAQSGLAAKHKHTPVARSEATKADDTNPVRTLALEAGTGRVVTLSNAAANIFVADPKIAEVRPASATNLFVFGLSAGHTTIAAMDSAGQTVAHYDVTVSPSSYAGKEIESAIAKLVAGSKVRVQTQTKGLQLVGSVRTPADAAQAMTIAKGYAPDAITIDNALTIETPTQVTVQVRVAQMSRTVVRNLGINWQAIGNFGSIGQATPALASGLNMSGTTFRDQNGNPFSGKGAAFNAVINALAQDNLAQVLAEPNLTVMSGQAATFQVGGEFPIPVAQQGGQITVSYKNYGIMLSLVPTVLNDGRIDLHVKPEVSELSVQNGLVLTTGQTNLTVPSLNVRRAETTVQLGSGQTFAIAGLLEHSTSDGSSGIPGLGETPGLGGIFRSSSLNRSEQELVIVVTPYIVRPVSNPSAMRLPTDNYNLPTDLERLLLMKQVSADRPPVPIRVPGDAGFMVQ